MRTRAASSRGENGFVDVVVGAELEPDDAVGLLAAGREHDHGELRSAPRIQRQSSSPSMPGSITSSTTRSGRLALEQRARVVAVACLERRVPLALEVADDDLADDRLVVDDENGGHALDRACFRITPG